MAGCIGNPDRQEFCTVQDNGLWLSGCLAHPADLLRALPCTKRAFTVRNIISRWAPPKENDTEAYIRTVLRLTGIGGKENLLPPENVDSYDRLAKLVSAMTCVECGIPMQQVDNEAIFQGYRMAFPENQAELDAYFIARDEYWNW